MDDIPRRIRRDRWTPAEKAIGEAIDAVEDLPPDERLTKAVVLLGEAKGAVADYVDGIHRTPEPTRPEGEREVSIRDIAEILQQVVIGHWEAAKQRAGLYPEGPTRDEAARRLRQREGGDDG